MNKNQSILINSKYVFPDYYSWPFFFTLQKHSETRRKQLSMWAELILKFCKDNKVWRLSKSVFYENLGKNPKINRRISLDSIDIIFASMVQKQSAMYVTQNNRDEVFILWKTLNEWEEFLYSSAVTRHSIGKLETLQGISQDDEYEKEEFYQIDRDLLVLILQSLEKKGKCFLVTEKDSNVFVAVKFT